jgi:hypothetical protein
MVRRRDTANWVAPVGETGAVRDRGRVSGRWSGPNPGLEQGRGEDRAPEFLVHGGGLG